MSEREATQSNGANTARSHRRRVGAIALAIGERYAPVVYVAAVVGLRWSGVAGLKVKALDLLRGTLNVQETLVRTAHNEKVIGPPKSEAGNRIMSLPATLVSVLAGHLARERLTAADTEAYVFTSPEGGPLDYSNWRRRYWLPACREAGLKGVGFHDLRRAAATALVLEGVDLKTAQVRLGHADRRMTLAVYAQALSEADRTAADRLDAYFRIGHRASTEVTSGMTRGARSNDRSRERNPRP